MAYPRLQRSRAHRKGIYTAGNLSLNSLSWANIPSIGTLTIEAQVGDDLEVALVMAMGSASEAVDVYFDVVTEINNAPVSSLGLNAVAPTSTTGDGIGGWLSLASRPNYLSGTLLGYTVQAADIANGQVTLRYRYRTGQAVARTVHCSTNRPIHYWVKNCGPADPE